MANDETTEEYLKQIQITKAHEDELLKDTIYTSHHAYKISFVVILFVTAITSYVTFQTLSAAAVVTFMVELLFSAAFFARRAFLVSSHTTPTQRAQTSPADKYTYTQTADANSLCSALARGIAGQQTPSMRNVLSGTFKGYQFRSFDYISDGGKLRRVLELTISRTFPEIVLSSLTNTWSQFTGIDYNGRYMRSPVELEGNFHEYFWVFVEKDKQIELREILNPKLMETLTREGAGFSYVFSGNRIYIGYYPSEEEEDTTIAANRDSLQRKLEEIAATLLSNF